MLIFEVFAFTDRSETISEPEASRFGQIPQSAGDVTINSCRRRHLKGELPTYHEMRVSERANRRFQFDTQDLHFSCTRDGWFPSIVPPQAEPSPRADGPN